MNEFVCQGPATIVYYFALQMGAPQFEPLFSQRASKAREILTDLGILR